MTVKYWSIFCNQIIRIFVIALVAAVCCFEENKKIRRVEKIGQSVSVELVLVIYIELDTSPTGKKSKKGPFVDSRNRNVLLLLRYYRMNNIHLEVFEILLVTKKIPKSLVEEEN